MDQRAFDGYVGSIYGAANTFSAAEYESSARFYADCLGAFLPSDRGAALLDVGCGAGHFLNYLKKAGYTNFSGIDLSPQQIALCREKVTDRVAQADAFEFFAAHAASFDCIACNDLIEHIAKPRVIEFLEKAGGALKSGGILILKTPNMGNPFNLYSRYFDFTHETGFSEMSLRQVLVVAGFTNVELRAAGMTRHAGIKKMAESLVRTLFFRLLTKIMQLQGFTAPTILILNLIAIGKKE